MRRYSMAVVVLALAMATTALAAGLAADADKPTEIKWEKSFEAALQKAAEAKKPVMVEFTGDSCSACKRMTQETFPAEEVIAQSVKFVNVKVDTDERGDLVTRYDIRPIPAFKFMTADGEVFFSTVGFMPAEPFAARLMRAMDIFTSLDEMKSLQAKFDEGEATPLEQARLGRLLVRSWKPGEAKAALTSALAALDAGTPAHVSATLDKLILDVRQYRMDAMGEIDAWLGANEKHERRWEAQYELALAQANSNNLVASGRNFTEISVRVPKTEVGLMASYYAGVVNEILTKENCDTGG